jgi:hypothetical protein
MSKNGISKMALLTKKFITIKNNYRHKLNDKNLFYDCNFFIYFCLKNNHSIF